MVAANKTGVTPATDIPGKKKTPFSLWRSKSARSFRNPSKRGWDGPLLLGMPCRLPEAQLWRRAEIPSPLCEQGYKTASAPPPVDGMAARELRWPTDPERLSHPTRRWKRRASQRPFIPLGAAPQPRRPGGNPLAAAGSRDIRPAPWACFGTTGYFTAPAQAGCSPMRLPVSSCCARMGATRPAGRTGLVGLFHAFMVPLCKKETTSPGGAMHYRAADPGRCRGTWCVDHRHVATAFKTTRPSPSRPALRADRACPPGAAARWRESAIWRSIDTDRLGYSPL